MAEFDRSRASGRSTPDVEDTGRIGSRRAVRPVDTDQDATVTISAVVPDATSQTYTGGRRTKRPTPVTGARRAATADRPPVDRAAALPAPPASAEDTIVFPAVGSLPGGRLPGARRAARRAAAASSRTRLLAGAAAMLIAAVGSISVSSPGLLAGADAALAKSYVGANATNAVDVSRNYDRELAIQKPLQAQQIAKANAEKRVKARQNEIIRNQWVIPVVGYRITAQFGQGGGYWSSGRHTGLDFAGPSGSTLVAVAAGTVTSTGYEGAYGNRTIITLDDGTEIWYCHQSSVQVQPGQKVAPGDVIGATGSTGNVTGPHLHLEVHPAGGGPVDPAAVLQSHGVTP